MLRPNRVLGGAAVAAMLSGAAAAQEIALRPADTHLNGCPTLEAVEHMGELLEERSGGRIGVEVFHSRRLGEEADTTSRRVSA